MFKRFFTFVFVLICAYGAPGVARGGVATMTIDQIHFSPNGDGKSDSLKVSYTLVDTANVLVLVLAGDSVTVVDTLAQVAGQLPNVKHVAAWDGTDSGGVPVAEDTFLVYLTATSSTETETLYERCYVDVTAPTVVITDLFPYLFAPTSPDSNQPDKVTIEYALSDPEPSSKLRVRATIHNAAGTQIHLLQNGDLASNGVYTHDWNGTSTAGTLRDEIYEVRINATDRASNSSSDFAYISVDRTEPVITFTKPKDNMSVRTVSDSLLEGWVYERNGIDTLAIRYDASRPFLPITNTTVRADTTYFNVPLADSTTEEKTYSIGVRARDKAGFRVITIFTIHVDRSSPLAPALTSAQGETRSPLYTLTGTKQSDHARLRIFRNDAPIDSFTTISQGSAFSRDVTLQPGPNKFYATGVDLAGNESAQSNTISVVYKSTAGLFIRQPFVANDAFQINLDKPSRSVTLRIYDLAGHLVTVIENATVSTNISIPWNGRNGDFVEVNKGPLVAVAEIRYTDDDTDVMREVFLYQP